MHFNLSARHDIFLINFIVTLLFISLMFSAVPSYSHVHLHAGSIYKEAEWDML